ncbi:hypothetical protein KFE94_17225 [bacterium SCSIO 12643]|nr:hypothetical protein KFE94_17225 [bacterium SCSIO 12643]
MNRLFSNKYGTHLNSVDRSENDLQVFIKDNWSSIFPELTFIKVEYTLSGNVRKKDRDGRIDILAFNRKSRKFVVVELKKDFDRNIRSQANDYRDFIEDNYLEIYIDVKEELGVNIPQSSKIIKDDIELILIAKDFAEKDLNRAKKTNNITCIKYNWFESKDDLILMYEFLNNVPSTKTIRNKPSQTPKISDHYPQYVIANIKSLGHPENMITKMLDHIQKKGQLTRGELKQACVKLFGYQNEKSGAITGNLNTLKYIGAITQTGKGDSSIIKFVSRKKPEGLILPNSSIEQKAKLLSIKANGRLIQGSTVPEFYKSALEYVVDCKLPIMDLAPYHTSKERYLFSFKPIHPNGKKFFKELSINGIYIETHKSRSQAMSDMQKLLKKLGCKVS